MANETTNQVKRKCQVQGRSGFFRLERQTRAVSKVRAILDNGEFGPEEEVATSEIFDIRKIPGAVIRAGRKVAQKEPEVYPADRPEKRVCLLKDTGDTRYHLLRKLGEQSKILKVGEGGIGEWIPSARIAEYFDVPNPDRPRYAARQPVNICHVQGRDGTFLLLRKGDKGARVVLVPEGYFGETVPVELITDEQKIDVKKAERDAKKNAGSELAGDSTSDFGGLDPELPQATPSEGDVEAAPVEASAPPPADAPVNPAPAAQAPAPQAPQAPAPQAPQAPAAQPARPAGVAPRPQGVPGGVAPRPQPGQAARPQPMPARPGTAPVR